MKVLLVSPKDPDKPGKLEHLMGGENTFTRALLDNPPWGVEFCHYQQALKKGKINYSRWQSKLSFLMKVGLFPPDAGFQCLDIREKFDLIHCHAYCLRLKNYSGPVVLSDSSSNFLFLKDYLGWSKQRIDFSYKIRKFICRKFNIFDPNLNLYQAKKLVVWSDFAKKVHCQLGADSKKITVIPPGITRLPLRKIKSKNTFNILFVGVWFERKGGKILLQAFKMLKEKYPQIRLFLVGQIPRGIKLPKDVWHKDFLPREELIKELFPKADALVLVPILAEGYGLVVLEAASLGIPSIVSRIYALPEIVEDKMTGFVISPGNPKILVEKLEKLILDPVLREKMGQNAQKRFFKEFWIKETNKKLLEVYQEAIE